MRIKQHTELSDLASRLDQFWPLACVKALDLNRAWSPAGPAPVFTVRGQYLSQPWTDWTRGFSVGMLLLGFDVTGRDELLELGRQRTLGSMDQYLAHFGVHDHGFNIVSTYGNLWRLIQEGRAAGRAREQELCELALKVSGAVQAMRWTATADGGGYIYSFNGPHSLFSDTIRSLRSLALAHQMGYCLFGEADRRVSLLERLVQHARTTARYNVYYGSRRDIYDVRGRVAHESIFNTRDGQYRAPATQQGYSPYSTWTRGLAWIMLGFAEQLEFLATRSDEELAVLGGRADIESFMLDACRATCDYYLEITPSCGVPYWDTAAPGLVQLGDYRSRPADPRNGYEPVDSSAAAIAAQALLRLGHYLGQPVTTTTPAGPSHNATDPTLAEAAANDEAQDRAALRYWQAGLTILDTLLSEPYLSVDPEHQGLLLHAVYHRPRGWDHLPAESSAPYGESCLWGDYHLMELALCAYRSYTGQPYYTFFGPARLPL